VRVQVRWEDSGTEQAKYTHFYGKENENHESGFFFFSFPPAVKRVESVSDRISYIILRGLWCHIFVLDFHAPTEDKFDNVYCSF
jgi:hypothetical protein